VTAVMVMVAKLLVAETIENTLNSSPWDWTLEFTTGLKSLWEELPSTESQAAVTATHDDDDDVCFNF